MAAFFFALNSTSSKQTKATSSNKQTMEHVNPMEIYNEENFLKEFRMTKNEIISLCSLVKEDLITAGHRKL